MSHGSRDMTEYCTQTRIIMVEMKDVKVFLSFFRVTFILLPFEGYCNSRTLWGRRFSGGLYESPLVIYNTRKFNRTLLQMPLYLDLHISRSFKTHSDSCIMTLMPYLSQIEYFGTHYRQVQLVYSLNIHENGHLKLLAAILDLQ